MAGSSRCLKPSDVSNLVAFDGATGQVREAGGPELFRSEWITFRLFYSPVVRA